MSYVKLVLMAVIWSGVFPALSILLRSMDVFAAVFLRFLSAAVVLLILLRWREGRLRLPSGRNLGYAIGLGLLGITFYNSLFTAGLARVEASRAALIVPTNPAFTALFAALFLGERLGWVRATGVVLSVSGALWVLCRGEPRHFALLEFGIGELFLVVCVFAWSAYTLISRAALASFSPLALSAWVTLFGVLPLGLPAGLEQAALAQVSWQSWAAMAYLVLFGTVLPNLWYYEGVKALGAARASQFINLVPPLAALESVWLLGEPATPALAVGALLVVAGLYLTNRSGSVPAH
ncbi:MAG: DMT family transporter [Betaproteobacteria bacterium]|nr:DMT family transporter [Betaproteobacteria bacterium]